MERRYTWEVSGEAVNYPPLIYVEGINPEALTDTLMWRLFDPDEHQVDVDTVKMTDPFVDLDIDSDNNGYINTEKNPARELAEDILELGWGKPVTYVPTSPFKDEGSYEAKEFEKSRFVPLRLRLHVRTPAAEAYKWYFVYDADVLALSQGDKPVPPGHPTHIPPGEDYRPPLRDYRVKAVGEPGSASNHVIEVQVRDSNDGLVMHDWVFVDVQDNGKHLSDWVIPNGWRIVPPGKPPEGPEVLELITPMPVGSKAMGPQDEGSGVTFNMGDAFTRDTYEHGFELIIDYEFTTGYIQADTNKNEITGDEDSDDRSKVSFVGNSGIKIGELVPPRQTGQSIRDCHH